MKSEILSKMNYYLVLTMVTEWVQLLSLHLVPQADGDDDGDKGYKSIFAGQTRRW